MKLWIGIDVGKAGAVAFVSQDGEWNAGYHKMPDSPKELFDLLRDLAKDGQVMCAMERVRSSPQMGVTSAFTFGRGFGQIEMGLIAAGIRYEEVLPQRWQKDLGCMTKGDKNVSKLRAQSLFPNLKITHYNADALLIAEWCKRTFP